ncbi:hypothetical protein N1851_033165 [Merluccius polli]|uniref:Uncharacterized protein n=1 Tax=Merluccius polli TaxID=89951 RepID=A0AA47M1R7_MERPO|nr:hypothetical protein N1851_033165 [Merluccius polli]
MEKWKQGMEEAYEITRENAHKAAVRSKRHYDSKVKSSVLQPGDRVFIRNMTPRGGPGKLRSHWEDTIHTVVRQVSKDIPVYELRPEKGKGRSRILHCNLLLPCDHLPLETSVQPRARQRNVEEIEQAEQSEEEDDDEYYLVPLHQSEPCLSGTINPMRTSTPPKLERIQSEENMSPEPDKEQASDQTENTQEREDSYVEDLQLEDAVPSPVPGDLSGEERQRPRRQHRQPKTFTYDRLGSPACYNLRTLQRQDCMVPWTYTEQPYHLALPALETWKTETLHATELS